MEGYILQWTDDSGGGGGGIDGGLHPAVDRQTTVEGIDGGLHPAVDSRQWRVLMEGYILQWTDDSGGH